MPGYVGVAAIGRIACGRVYYLAAAFPRRLSQHDTMIDFLAECADGPSLLLGEIALFAKKLVLHVDEQKAHSALREIKHGAFPFLMRRRHG